MKDPPNLELVQADDHLVIIKPNPKILANNDGSLVENLEKLLKLRCKNRVAAWITTEGTVRIQHVAEQDTIKKILGLSEASLSPLG